jgi:precorrin-4 methylase
LALNDCSQQKEIERYIDASIDGALKGFAIEAKARIKAGDGQFFSVFGETIRRLSEGELPVNPQRAAILAYAEVILGQKPDHRFTAAELQDKVPWPPKSGYTARPEERQLRRLMDELQIPQ